MFLSWCLGDFVVKTPRHKFHKELFTHRGGGELPAIVVAHDENLQSRFIVQRVLELREQGVALSDIAVLFRSSYLSFDLEIELNKANVPFVKFGGFKFIETSHIKDLLAYLRVIENPRDAVAWNRILLLIDGVGPRTAEKIITDLLAGKSGQSPFRDDWKGYPDRIRELFEALRGVTPEHLAPADKVQSLLLYYNPLFTRRYDDFNKRRKDLETYFALRKEFLVAQKNCRLCDRTATDVHHRLGRGRFLNAIETWMPLCRRCHMMIHAKPSWAMEQGYLWCRTTGKPFSSSPIADPK